MLACIYEKILETIFNKLLNLKCFIKNFFRDLGLIENSIETVILIRKQLIKLCHNKKLPVKSCGSEFTSLRYS